MSKTFQEVAAAWQPFDEYKVTAVIGSLAGGVPRNRDIIKGWINATNKNKSDEERQRLVEATEAELSDLSEEKEAKSWVGFKSDDKGLYIEGRQLKAMLKEAANIVKNVVPNGGAKDKGIKNLKSKVADHVFVAEDKVYLDRAAPDQTEERPVHVMTAQGPRSSLKRSDLVKDVTIEFTVRRFDNGTVPEETLYAILVYAQSIGVGADRSQGHGTLTVTGVEKVKSALK